MSDLDRAKAIFDQAVAAPAADRDSLVRREAGGDEALARLVLGLLHQHDASSEQSMANAAMVRTAARGSQEEERVGPYKLVSPIGEGGFGTVYLAEQREPIRRRVALKVLKLGMDSKEVLARFEAERQALALMDHPNVAKVYDAGTTERGQPYFAMEHVPGVAVTEFCDDQRLAIKERVELFITICNAVQHAHSKGIIHRDLKPSNILVMLVDGKPVAKVIDFGIAKATSQQLTARTLFTETGRLMGTPEYMSPEQAGTSGLDVDTRSDIYSLGVILYELLGGVLPFESETLRKAGFEGTIRLIKEVEPPRLTTRLSKASKGGESTEATDNAASPADDAPIRKARVKQTPQEVAAKRRTDLSGLIRQLRGDLDWIVARAMEKERARRYETANAFAMDLRRHLNNEPVLAGPPSRTYRLSRAVKRNKAWIAAGTAAAVLLVAGIIGTSWGLFIAKQKQAETTEALAQAKARAEELEQVAKFQEGQLSEVDPALMGLRIRDDLIDDIVKGMEQDKASPEAIAKTREDLLNTLSSADLTGVAVKALDRNIFSRTIKAIDEQFKSQPLIHARLLHALAATMVRIGIYEQAVELERKALAIRTREQGPHHPDTLTSMGDLVEALTNVNEQEALQIARKAVDLSQHHLGTNHAVTAYAMSQLAFALNGNHEFAEAAVVAERSWRLNRQFLGDNHRQTLYDYSNLASATRNLGKIKEALAMYLEQLNALEAKGGSECRDSLICRSNITGCLRDLGRTSEALERSAQDLELFRKHIGDEHLATIFAADVRISLLNRAGRYAESVEVVNRFEPIARRAWAHRPFDLGIILARIGAARAGVGDFARAESTLLESHELLIRAGQKPGTRWLKECAEALVALYDAWEKAEPGNGYDAKAAEWRKKLEETEAATKPPADKK